MKQMIRRSIDMKNLISYHVTNHPFLQVKKAIEELDELANELEKFNKGDFDIELLFDELFDAWIMIECLGELFIGENSKYIKLWFSIQDKKIEREIKRWKLRECPLY